MRVSKLILIHRLPSHPAYRLKILQSTIIGVIVLHLLLIPGTAFLIGGSSIWEQHLNPHLAQLNNSLLTVGWVTATFVPAVLGLTDTNA